MFQNADKVLKYKTNIFKDFTENFAFFYISRFWTSQWTYSSEDKTLKSSKIQMREIYNGLVEFRVKGL